MRRDVDDAVGTDDTVLVQAQQINSGKDLVTGMLTALILAPFRKIISTGRGLAHVEEWDDCTAAVCNGCSNPF